MAQSLEGCLKGHLGGLLGPKLVELPWSLEGAEVRWRLDDREDQWHGFLWQKKVEDVFEDSRMTALYGLL